MRHSEFWRLMNNEFGSAYARSVGNDQHLSALGSLTPVQALDHGFAVKEVWSAVCDAMDVPPERRAGKNVAPRRR